MNKQKCANILRPQWNMLRPQWHAESCASLALRGKTAII